MPNRAVIAGEGQRVLNLIGHVLTGLEAKVAANTAVSRYFNDRLGP